MSQDGSLTETVIATSDGTWNSGANWVDTSAPAPGDTLVGTRLNVNGLMIYDLPG